MSIHTYFLSLVGTVARGVAESAVLAIYLSLSLSLSIHLSIHIIHTYTRQCLKLQHSWEAGCKPVVSHHHTYCHIIIHTVTSSYILSHHHTCNSSWEAGCKTVVCEA
jgi:hypothetical protein